MKKIKLILINSLPIPLMIGLIPVITDDYILTGVYITLSILSLMIHREKNDILFYFLGFFFMLISESIFISTGVETFLRNSLFGFMPLWLLFLWAYGFIAIKRLVHIMEK
jgi:hypothetical protein